MTGEGAAVVDAYLKAHAGSRLYLRQELEDSIWPGCWIGSLYTGGRPVCGALGRTQLDALQGIANELAEVESLATPPEAGTQGEG